MPTDRRQIEDAEDVVRGFVEHWNRHDMEAFAELFSEDAEFVNVVGAWWKGRAEIKEAHVLTHATLFRNSHLGVDEVTVRLLRPDVAVVRAKWNLTGQVSPSGEPLQPRSGILMTVLVVQDGHWKIVDAQNTDIIEGVLVPPPPPT